MRISANRVSQLIGLLLLTGLCASLPVWAQDEDSPDNQVSAQPLRGMYTVLPGKVQSNIPAAHAVHV
jgi:hypothetical protein